MIEAEIDGDGYPTEVALTVIREWRPDPDEGYGALIEFIGPIFEHHGKIVKTGGVVEIVTGGWSGCEDAIEALQENQVFWLMCWLETVRGGGYSFAAGGIKSDGLPDREITIENRGAELTLYRFDNGEMEVEVEDDPERLRMYLTKEQCQQIGRFLSAHNLLS